MASGGMIELDTTASAQQQRFTEIRAALHADTVDWADMHARSSVLSDSINDMLTSARNQGMARTNPTLFVTMNSWAASQISEMLLCRLGEEVTEAQQRLARVEKAVEALTRQS